MRTASYILIALIVVGMGSISHARSKEHTYGSFENVQFVKNYDGDSITFYIPGVPSIIGNDMKIRIRGIDTAELKKKTCRNEITKGREAKKMVKSLLRRAKVINLHRVGRGKYFRFVADVEFDGKDLASTLKKNGLAVEYNGGTKNHDWCRGKSSFKMNEIIVNEKKVLQFFN
ncbi:MAG TPA: thermonuclease family protein [Desulfocapsa sulfexigens]|nr:thermonuclease family protein [Desulfocapsa sulfexigens]